MASKKEIEVIEKEIEEHRENQPLMANGLILALSILTDEHEPEYIDVDQSSDDMTGCFSWALNQAENNGKKVSRKSDSENTLSFENNIYIVTSDLRGREALTDFTMDMIKSNDWQIVK